MKQVLQKRLFDVLHHFDAVNEVNLGAKGPLLEVVNYNGIDTSLKIAGQAVHRNGGAAKHPTEIGRCMALSAADVEHAPGTEPMHQIGPRRRGEGERVS